MRNYFLITFCFFLLITNVSIGQSSKSGKSGKSGQSNQSALTPGSSKEAKDNFSLGNYKDALDQYLSLLKTDSTNIDYNFKVGVCYLYTNIDKTKAIYYLEKIITNPKVEKDALYEIGRAYMFNYDFEKAITYFKKYKQIANGKEVFEITSDRMIQMCEEAKKQVEHPVNVTIENIGTEINSPSADFNPFISGDESFIVFTTRRPSNTGNMIDFDGYNTSDIFISYQKYNKWSKAKGIGNTINSALVEESVGLSSDGSKLFIFADNYNAMGKTMISTLKGKSFQKPDFMGNTFSSIKLVTSATISPDKKILVFACDKNEENAGMDLYMSKKLPSGGWSEPVNLGSVVNTVYNEDFPSFSPDGSTLYFCSQGHNSMGGYDLFKTSYDRNTDTWSEPVNLGYPINTPDDDMTISFSNSGRHAYISSARKGGCGNLDIYKVIFNDVDPAYMVYSGIILTKDSLNIYKIPEKSENDSSKTKLNSKQFSTPGPTHNDELKDSSLIKKEIKYKKIKPEIIVTNKTSNIIFGKYQPNKITGKYVIALPPGDFEITVKANGFENYSESVKVIEKSSNDEIAKDIVLQPVLKTEKTN